MLPLIGKLFKALESEGVVYCHWKSNAFMVRAAHGEDDLDLLISPASRQIFLEILHRFGFKEALPPQGRPPIPGILSYYGYDETSGELIHVHVHYKLVLGHALTKNYHLPIESAYLASSFQGEFFRTPAPEFEWTVFVIRMTLKYSAWNSFLGGKARLSGREGQELEYLEGKATREQVGHILAKHLPFLKLEWFDECVRSLQPGRRLWVRFRAGYRLHKALRGCRLRSRGLDIWLQFWRRLLTAGKRRLLRKIPKRRMKNGGLLVAFIGGDGAGKTTVIEGISEWLSPRFVTMNIHLGKPSWSRMTILIRGILKVGRLLGFYEFTRVPLEFRDEDNPVFPGYPSLIRAVCTARDRSLLYKKARRLADKWVLVICDRYPLPGVMSMDGPQVEWMTKTLRGNLFTRLLGRLEMKYYQSVLPPDLLFVLKADPTMAVERKQDESPASVRARSKEIWEKDWGRTAAYLVDANQQKAQVLHAVKARLWANL